MKNNNNNSVITESNRQRSSTHTAVLRSGRSGNLEHGELLPLLLDGERRVRVEDHRGAGGLAVQLPLLGDARSLRPCSRRECFISNASGGRRDRVALQMTSKQRRSPVSDGSWSFSVPFILFCSCCSFRFWFRSGNVTRWLRRLRSGGERNQTPNRDCLISTGTSCNINRKKNNH